VVEVNTYLIEHPLSHGRHHMSTQHVPTTYAQHSHKICAICTYLLTYLIVCLLTYIHTHPHTVHSVSVKTEITSNLAGTRLTELQDSRLIAHKAIQWELRSYSRKPG